MQRGAAPGWRRRAAVALTALAVPVLAGAALAAQAQQSTPADPVPAVSDEEVVDFTLRSMLFVFFHELGHALVGELDLPTVGPEEDVVDEFATFLLIEAARETQAEPETSEAVYQVVLGAAESWRLMWTVSGELLAADPAKFPFWDEHNLDVRRYFNIVCLLYGSDPRRFWPLLTKAGIPEERARKCEKEYRKKWAAWQLLMKPHLVAEGDHPPAGAGRFGVAFGEAKDKYARKMEALFQQNRMWEEIAAAVHDTIVLPHDLTLAVESCGAVSSWWDADRRRITLCYEMMRLFAGLYILEAQGRLQEVAAKAGAGKGGDQTPPAGQPSPPAVPAPAGPAPDEPEPDEPARPAAGPAAEAPGQTEPPAPPAGPTQAGEATPAAPLAQPEAGGTREPAPTAPPAQEAGPPAPPAQAEVEPAPGEPAPDPSGQTTQAEAQPVPAAPDATEPPGAAPFPGMPGQPAAPVQPAAPAQPEVDPRFIGTWQAQAGSGQGLVITRITFQADGTFMQQSYGPATAPFHLWGRYAPVGTDRVQFVIAGWSPQQSCTQQGCTPIRLRTQDFTAFQFLAPSVLQLGANTFYRTR